MNDFIFENKKRLIILGVIILLAILFAILANVTKSNKSVSKDESVKEIARMYYEEFYYPSVLKKFSDPTYYFDKAKDGGIKVYIQDIVDGIDNFDSSILSNKNEICDLGLSYITYYPNNNYAKTDYTYETNFICTSNGGN